MKVDCFPRKENFYHVTEVERRRRVEVGEFSTFLATREDLILSKLLWARESRSQIQLRDVRNLASDDLDDEYVHRWATSLDVSDLWAEVSK
ncbi:MAG: hypothetical protein M3373_13325 [Gemmatimonadota bacterium]|nr:hypothetical protein [Gemmatimonadota bacterium]